MSAQPTPSGRTSAQSVVELALMLPLLTLLLVGLIEFGFLLYAHVQVSSAVREAARAASLYRSTRYATLSENDLGSNNPTECDTNVDGWSLQQTAEQAVVRFPLTSGNNGVCPTTSGAPIYSALGLLNATRSNETAICPTGSVDGWNLGITPAPVYASSSSWPIEPGDRASVTLCYPYRLLLLAQLLPFLDDPVWVNKAVNFEYQP